MTGEADAAGLGRSSPASRASRVDLPTPLRAASCMGTNRDQGSTRGKIKRAAWDDTFLLKILATA